MIVTFDTRTLSRVSREQIELLNVLGTFIDSLAEILSRTYKDNQAVTLPDGILFEHWPSNEYRFSIPGKLELGSNSKNRGSLLIFTHILIGGWLDRVSNILERENFGIKSVFCVEQNELTQSED